MYINNANLLGDVLSVSKLNKTKNGTLFCILSLETAVKYNSPQGFRKDTEVHHIVAYGKLAQKLQSISKGVRATVQGRIRSSTNEIIAESIQWEKMVGQEIS